MNLRERLKEAYENVSFSADKTWTNSPNAYHKSNLVRDRGGFRIKSKTSNWQELYLAEHNIERKRQYRNRPRTVRECIPTSRLAQYSNYIYNESREMSYASSASNSDRIFSTHLPTEPWEMPEVGELFRWFLKNEPEDSFSRLERCYESPLLNVNGFEDKILKIQITEDRVKNLWDNDSQQFCERPKINQMVVNFFTSPMKNVFLFSSEHDYDHEWFRNVSITRDIDQLEQLSKSFKDQNSFISKFLAGNSDAPPAGTEPVSTEVLYSEVLQGLSPSRKFMSSLKSEQARVLTMDDSSVHQDSFTNYTILNSQRAGQEESIKNDNFDQNNFPKVSQVPPQTSNKFVPQKTSTANVYFQTDNNPQAYPRHKYPSTTQFPMDSVPRYTRTSTMHPFSTSCVQQTYFYSPAQTVQRWIPSNFTNSHYPTQIFASSWFAQNPVISSSYDISRYFGPVPVNTTKVPNEPDPRDAFNGRFDCGRLEDIDQFKETAEIDPFLEEHQVSTSISEELEIQALEQYSNSNENFYQELERQAAEQYASSPE
ncbi:uncharacterized protein BDFB_001088 [Asbolus verrucosus]|uniref:Uncharacterized protein n=1 Tax=Asbolus verrucosus TaxID=1661398 RepID=A0A482W5F8_ASBVE|nr:uncharacterized protein BDFB_001088 [Asbolus verrucosus]